MHSGAVVSTVASQQDGPGLDSGSGSFCVGFVCSPCRVFPAWVLSRYSSFLPQSKNLLGVSRLIGHSNLPVGVEGYLSLYVSPVMNRQLVQDDSAFTDI